MEANTSYRYKNPFALKCRGLLRFSDLKYSPVSYAFNLSLFCNKEIISFIVPLRALDRMASIIWYTGILRILKIPRGI